MADRRNGREYPPDIQRLRNHLYAVATRHGIAMCELDKRGDGDVDDTQYHAVCPAIGSGSVNVPMVESERDYAIALHEFGHAVEPKGHGVSKRGTFCPCPKHRYEFTTMDLYDQLGEETVAWNWARANAVMWTPAMAAAEQFAVDTYLRGIEMFRLLEELEQLL